MGIVAWNIPNMITVILMVLVGYVVLAAGAQIFMRLTGRASNDNNPGTSAFRWAFQGAA